VTSRQHWNLVAPRDETSLQAAAQALQPARERVIFDEVMTGSLLCARRRAALMAWKPDLTTLGKGNRRRHAGPALSAARRDIMQAIAPLGPVYQAGTLSGNPVRWPQASRH